MPELVSANLIEKDITYDGGKTMRIMYRPLTRAIRQAALTKAVDAFQEANPGKLGYYYHVLEREVVGMCLVQWGLPLTPQVGWELLDPDTELGDAIAKAVGVMKVVESIEGKGPTVDEAKNSP